MIYFGANCKWYRLIELIIICSAYRQITVRKFDGVLFSCIIAVVLDINSHVLWFFSYYLFLFTQVNRQGFYVYFFTQSMTSKLNATCVCCKSKSMKSQTPSWILNIRALLVFFKFSPSILNVFE